MRFVEMKILLLLFLLVAVSRGEKCNKQHFITVRSSGKDSSECLDGVTSCKTLEFVLHNLTSCSTVDIHSDQILTRSFIFRGLYNVVIAGSSKNTSTNIRCGESLVFEKVSNITIQGLHWLTGNTTHMKQKALMQFCDSSKLSIVNCSFTMNTNRSSVLLYNMSDGDVLLEHCNFTTSRNSSGGGIEIIQNLSADVTRASFFIIDCSFIGCSSERSGGAIFLYLTGFVSQNTIHVMNSTFVNSTASHRGGHITINMTDNSSNNTVVILRSSFDNGRAKSGGGLFVEINSRLNNKALNTIIVKYSNFTRNQARHGGAVDYSQVMENTVMFSHCKFESNIAEFVSAMSFILYENPKHLVTRMQPIVFHNCHWTNHTSTKIRQMGTILTVQIPLLFTGSTIIKDTSNREALYVGSAVVTFEGTVLFKNSIASMRGGAIYLTGASFINITRGLILTFHSCSAMYGGAIYYENSVYQLVKDKPYPCVFSYEGSYKNYNMSQWNATINFKYNTALRAGHSIFLNNYAICTEKIAGKLFLNNSVFQGLQGHISSYPDHITLDNSARIIGNNTYEEDLNLGQNMLLQVTPKDIFGQVTVATMAVKLDCPPMKLNKQDVYIFNGKLIQTSIHLMGPQVTNTTLKTCNLTLITLNNPVKFIVIKLNVRKCNFGYVYKNEKCECVGKAYHDSEVTCNSSLGTAYIKEGLWFGNLTHDQQIVYPCSRIQCNFSNCHNVNSSLNLRVCRLPALQEDQDQQCLNNLGGPMCSLCNNCSVFTFGASLCIPKEQCSVGSIVALACLYLLCIAVIILVFLAVLNMSFKVGSGYLYAFVYYFTVVPYFLSSAELYIVLYVTNLFNGVIFLNLKFLGLLPLCSIPSLNRLQHEALHYLSPLFILSALLCLSCIARHKPAVIQPGKFIIHGICTLILLTFTSLSKTSTTILDSITFGSNKCVKIQPDSLYFDVKQHLPFAILALFVIAFLLIPFTVLLLFEPLIVRCVNLIKIRPFLDDFQACFRDSRRWMAGFYFLGRLLILSFVPIGPKTSELLIRLVNICILFLIVVLQPYRERHQNLIDSLLMLNLTIVGLLSKYADSVPVKIGLILLVIIAALYGVMVFVLAIIGTIRRRTQWRYLHMKSYKEMGIKLRDFVSSMKKDKDCSDTEGILHVEIIHSRRDYNPQTLREELLSYEEMSEN